MKLFLVEQNTLGFDYLGDVFTECVVVAKDVDEAIAATLSLRKAFALIIDKALLTATELGELTTSIGKHQTRWIHEDSFILAVGTKSTY
jgi:hypothetical protein